ncbi:MAG: HDIG domain-containing protein [Bacteroidaceae bacterium]|nr:HDIG domain-containing protein [Bacteroidaceae bacterium]
MTQNNGKTDSLWKAFLYRLIIFLCTVGLIVYFMPRDVKFNYQFDLDKPWKYGQLIATFDFPIYKSDEVVKREQDSILKRFQPYYILDKSVGKQELTQLRADYQETLKELLPNNDYYTHLQRTLTEVYNAGIISNENLSKLQEDSIGGIMVVDDKIANQISIGKIFSIRDAYVYLLTADTAHYDSDILRRCSLNEFLTPNLTYDEERTSSAREDLFNSYSWATGLVQSGEKIVERGEIIDSEKYNILESLRKESINRSESQKEKMLMLAGQVIFTGIFIGLFMLYLEIYRKKYFNERNSLLMMFSQMVIFCVATELLVYNNLLSVYMLPYVMMPVIIRTFLDSRTAFMSFAVTILICSITLRYPHEFILVQLAAGLIAIYSLKELSQRSQIFRTVFLVILTYLIVYFAYELITENDFSKMNRSMYIYLAVSGFLVLFAYPLLFLFEKAFGYTSNVTLIELSNTNNPLLRQLSELAPGTFQHSMQVSNLVFEAASRIGANGQLARTGALYHDIGKMENPGFFTENQGGGLNPHKSLSYEQSAQVVINHVTDGLKLAEKNNLPKVIKEFITTHHGAGKTKYFYISWKNEHPGEEPDASLFSYPGPNPFTPEQAILMMADAVEAASRSMKEYTEESIDQLVDKILDSQVAEGYFNNCPINFQNIQTIKQVFKAKLKSMYHPRISYPELKDGHKE